MLSSWFKKTPEILQEPTEDGEGTHEDILNQLVTTINIALLPDGTIQIFYTWKDSSEDVAKLCGEMLYKLNSGELEKACIETLLNYASSEILTSKFVNKVFAEWAHHKGDKEPVIRPINVLKVNILESE